jgi:hypothetical protein
MADSLTIFLEWIGSSKQKDEMNRLCEFVLQYIPGYETSENDEIHNYIHDLAAYSQKHTSPFKIYGVCLFIFTIIDNSFKVFQIAGELGVVKSELSNNTKFQLTKSWDQLVKRGFNPNSFYDELLKRIEPSLYGE